MNSETFLTQQGVSTPLKDALLARYPKVVGSFNQTSFIESLHLSPQVLADIWLPIGFPPASFDPFNDEEERAATTGQFIAPSRNRHGADGSGSTGGYGNNRRGGLNQSQNQRSNHRNQLHQRSNDNISNSGSGTGYNNIRYNNQNQNQTNNNNNANPRFSRPQHQHQQQRHFESHDHDDNDVIEDPDNLWATPSNDISGLGNFGSFDENGIFKTGNDFSLPPLRPEDFVSSLEGVGSGMKSTASSASSSSINASSFFNPQPQISINPTSPPATVTAIPTITPNTQWLYRDPAGHVQGPFPSHRMLEWYNGKYFPEHLPLRREQDPFFEPLSTWKSKCAGQIPFSAYSPVAEPPQPQVQAQVPILSPRVTFAAQQKSVQQSEWFDSQPTATTTTNFVSVAPHTVTQTTNVTNTRSVPIESLFAKSPTFTNASTSAKTETSDVAMSSASTAPVNTSSIIGGWKKLEKPVIPKFGQLDVNDEFKMKCEISETESPVVISSTKVNPSTAASVASTVIPAAAPVPTTVAPLETRTAVEVPQIVPVVAAATSPTPTWSTPASSMKKISLADILKNEEEDSISAFTISNTNGRIGSVLEQPQPQPQLSASNGGWAKISTSPIQSLSSIQAEEARRESEQRRATASSSASAPQSASSKSFADLVRSAGVASGNIVVTSSSSPAPIVAAAPIVVPSAQATKAVSEPTFKPVTILKKPEVTTTTTATTSTTASSKSGPQKIDDWCIATLSNTSISKMIDPQTCAALLLSLPSAASVYTFGLETLQPILLESSASDFDLASFAKEFSSKKFGKNATEKVNWSRLNQVPKLEPSTAATSFETVKRKK